MTLYRRGQNDNARSCRPISYINADRTFQYLIHIQNIPVPISKQNGQMLRARKSQCAPKPAGSAHAHVHFVQTRKDQLCSPKAWAQDCAKWCAAKRRRHAKVVLKSKCVRSLAQKDGNVWPAQSGILRPGLMLRSMSIRPHLSSHSLPFSL